MSERCKAKAVSMRSGDAARSSSSSSRRGSKQGSSTANEQVVRVDEPLHSHGIAAMEKAEAFEMKFDMFPLWCVSTNFLPCSLILLVTR